MPIRLLHTRELRFKVFGSFNDAKSRPPPYAILSHVWLKNWNGHREIVFQDMDLVSPKERSEVGHFIALDRHGELDCPRQSHAKMLGACQEAANREYDWIWIDTCCINKRDVAETQEAITSMFTWYSEAAACFVLLADVAEDIFPSGESHIDWFTRGWTLQELLASPDDTTTFFNARWESLGTKGLLIGQLASRTGISSKHLYNFTSACAAVKLSWATGRETSLVEDRVYSLLGLFDVQVDIQYGTHAEKHAFRWLQEAIVNQTRDESIFAWTSKHGSSRVGMLAPSIECFQHCKNLTIHSSKRKPRVRDAYSMSKGAVLFQVPMDTRPVASIFALLQSPFPCVLIEPEDLVRQQRSKRRECVLTLNCWRTDGAAGLDTVCIRLSKGDRSETWQRVNFAQLEWSDQVKGVSDKWRVHRVDRLTIVGPREIPAWSLSVI